MDATGGLFQQFINYLFRTGDISVPDDFHSRCIEIQKMVDDDISGVINTILDYSIFSASNAQYKIECEDDKLEKLLNTWLQKINLTLKGVPTGLQELSREYFKERWQGSSLCLLRIKGWEELTIGNNTIEVPTIMWYVNGSSVYVKRDNDKNYKLGSDTYYLDENYKIKVPEGDKEEIIIQKPFNRWFDQYATPYLIRKGVYKNWLGIKVLQEKSDEVISKILPYLFIIKKGTEKLFLEGNVEYDDPDLKKIVDELKDQLETYKNQKGKTPTNATTFDTEYDHLIPDLGKILREELYRQGYRAILAGLGFIDMLEIASTRQETRINPKPFVAEINNGVEGFKSMLLDIVYKIIERNKEKHPKLFSDNNKLLIVNSPLKINVEQILDQLRSGYIYGASSITTYQEVLGLDPETEKERRQKELDEGLEDLFYPHLIQNREDIPDRMIPSKPKTTKKENEKQTEKEKQPEHMQEALYKNIAKCKECGYEFDYLSIPEAGMGWVKCPKCEKAVTQEDLIEDAELIEETETEYLKVAIGYTPEITENYIRIRVKDPKDFEQDSFRIITLSKEKGIKAVIGRLKGKKTTTVQSYLFDKNKWTVKKAQEWVKKHKAMIEEFVESSLIEDLEIAPYKNVEELIKKHPYMKKYPKGALEVFVEVFNKNLPKGEDYAFPIAYTAMKRWLKKHGYKKVNDKWVKSEENE